MFDFDAGKFIIIGIVALIVIGPKELPRVLRQLGHAVGKLRRMAAEFQAQFMEAVREADMADLKADVAKLADDAKVDVAFNPLTDIKKELQGAIDKADAGTSTRSSADRAAAEAEAASAMLAFPNTSESPLGSSASPQTPAESDGGEAPPLTAADEPAPDSAAGPEPAKAIDDEMKALASALKAEIEAAPQAGQPADLLRRRSTLRDNA
jgi:sec-independent protein translocase protein TatB